jgi:Sec-independent protein translocase protein TatA
MFGFSMGEILLIALIALLLFGNEKLPQNIKKFVKGWNQSKKVVVDLQKSWNEVKLDLKSNIDPLEEKKLPLNQEKQGKKEEQLSSDISVKVADHIVSQEEIDSFKQV